MVEEPGAYRWSSYGHNASGGPDAIVTPHPIYLALGRDDVERRLAYRELVGNPSPTMTCRRYEAMSSSSASSARRVFRLPSKQ
jgi:hypothetical protein